MSCPHLWVCYGRHVHPRWQGDRRVTQNAMAAKWCWTGRARVVSAVLETACLVISFDGYIA